MQRLVSVDLAQPRFFREVLLISPHLIDLGERVGVWARVILWCCGCVAFCVRGRYLKYRAQDTTQKNGVVRENAARRETRQCKLCCLVYYTVTKLRGNLI